MKRILPGSNAGPGLHRAATRQSCAETGCTGSSGAPAPGGVYLCQVDGRVSCGACCGLYNLPVADEDTLSRMLRRRSDKFAGTPRRLDAIEAFGRRMRASIRGRQPVEGFHHCPFLGMVGKDRNRVGCLLHPLADGNDGIDWRGLSHYGGMACRIYFCPSHGALAPVWKRIVRQTAGGWYLYGLVITEDELLTAFFSAVEEGIRRPLTESDIAGDPVCTQALRRFFRLKCTWPHRPAHVPGPVNYFFKDRERTRPPVVYPKGWRRPSPFDAMLRALGSAFETEDALREAEGRLRGPLSCIVDRIGSRSGGDRGRT